MTEKVTFSPPASAEASSPPSPRGPRPAARSTRDVVAPLVKWAGGKRKIDVHVATLLGPLRGRYFEPFCGGAAVFLAMRAVHRPLFPATIGDACRPLIAMYRIVRDDAYRPRIAAELRRIERDFNAPGVGKVGQRALYGTWREQFNRGCYGNGPPVEMAALFLFLNKAGYNGLWRVNQSGEFNVPRGDYDEVKLPSKEHLDAFAQTLESATLFAGDYQEPLSWAGDGDAVYLDPPYDGGFTNYDAPFNWPEQLALADNAASAARRGARVVASNRATDRIRQLYSDLGFTVQLLDVRHSIGAKGDRRRLVGEILASRGPG